MKRDLIQALIVTMMAGVLATPVILHRPAPQAPFVLSGDIRP